MEEDLDKTVIYINSRNCRSINNVCSYVYDMVEPLKDVKYIKAMKTEVFAKHAQFFDGDPVFVKLNDYKRLSTVIDGNATKFFETVSIDISEKSSTSLVNEIVPFKKDSSTSFHKCDPNLYVFKPIEANIKTMTIELYDKDNIIFDTSKINGFNMTICVYHLHRKLSQASSYEQ